MVQPKLWQRDMKFGTWNVRNLYRSRSFRTVAREFARYKLGLLVVQQGRWEKGGTVRVEVFFNIYIYIYIFFFFYFYGRGNEKHQPRTECFVGCTLHSSISS